MGYWPICMCSQSEALNRVVRMRSNTCTVVTSHQECGNNFLMSSRHSRKRKHLLPSDAISLSVVDPPCRDPPKAENVNHHCCYCGFLKIYRRPLNLPGHFNNRPSRYGRDTRSLRREQRLDARSHHRWHVRRCHATSSHRRDDPFAFYIATFSRRDQHHPLRILLELSGVT